MKSFTDKQVGEIVLQMKHCIKCGNIRREYFAWIQQHCFNFLLTRNFLADLVLKISENRPCVHPDSCRTISGIRLFNRPTYRPYKGTSIRNKSPSTKANEFYGAGIIVDDHSRIKQRSFHNYMQVTYKPRELRYITRKESTVEDPATIAARRVFIAKYPLRRKITIRSPEWLQDNAVNLHLLVPSRVIV